MKNLTSRVSASNEMYIVGVKRSDGTVIQAIVKADNESEARFRAFCNFSNMTNGLIKSSRLFDFEDNWEFANDEKQNFKILDVAEFNTNNLELDLINGLSNPSFGHKSYRVTLLDGGCLYYNANNVRYLEEAYANAVNKFYRIKPVEGFVFELCQSYKVQKDRVRIIEYEYEVGKNNNYYVVMQQYADYSIISMQHNAAGITFVGQALTIEQMLGKLISMGTMEEKAFQLIELMLETNHSYVWNNSDIIVTDRNEKFNTKKSFEDYLKYENVIDITHQKSIDINWEEVETKQKRDNEYNNVIEALGKKLGVVYTEYKDLMTAEQKDVIYQMCDKFVFGLGWGGWYNEDDEDDSLGSSFEEDEEDDGWAAISANDDGWGSCSGFSNDNDSVFGSGFGSYDEETHQPTKPKKSTKPKSNNSKSSKGKAKVGK